MTEQERKLNSKMTKYIVLQDIKIGELEKIIVEQDKRIGNLLRQTSLLKG